MTSRSPPYSSLGKSCHIRDQYLLQTRLLTMHTESKTTLRNITSAPSSPPLAPSNPSFASIALAVPSLTSRPAPALKPLPFPAKARPSSLAVPCGSNGAAPGPWGILTGHKPLQLAGQLLAQSRQVWMVQRYRRIVRRWHNANRRMILQSWTQRWQRNHLARMMRSILASWRLERVACFYFYFCSALCVISKLRACGRFG